MPDATLVIKDSNGEVVKEWVSGITPYKVTLDPGKYTLTVIIAPDGYAFDSESTNFEIASGGNDVVINFMVERCQKKEKRR